MRARTRTAALLAVLVAASAPPSPASAGNVFQRSKTKTISDGLAVADITVQCPNGANAVGGGYKAPPFSAGAQRYPVVFESTKQGQGAWRVRVQLTEGSSGSAKVKAFAYCDRSAPPTTEISEAGSTSVGNEIKSVTARCPGSKSVQAGGFATPEPGYTGGGNNVLNEVSASTPAGSDGWRVQVVSGFSFTPFPSSFEAFAYCAGAPTPVRKTGKKAITNPFGASELQRGTATTRECRRDVAAGGFSQKPIQFGSEPRFIHINAVRGVRGRLKASGAQGGAGAGEARSTLKAVALCG